MLGIGCPDRHPLTLIHSPPQPKMHRPRRALPRERVRSWVDLLPSPVGIRMAESGANPMSGAASANRRVGWTAGVRAGASIRTMLMSLEGNSRCP